MRARYRASIILLGCLTLAMSFSGCISKSDAKMRAHRAYIAGQQDALAHRQPPRHSNVKVLGNVQRPVLVWSQDLTVMQAIVDAEYLGGDPRTILLRRNGEEYRIDPHRLLEGEDFLLEPGDELEIRE
jgi:hypothetical protein